MITYVSTFLTQTKQEIEKILYNEFGETAVVLFLEGAVVYKTDAPIQKVQALQCFHNTFVLIDSMENVEVDTTASIVKKLSQTSCKLLVKSLKKNGEDSFRIVISRENQMQSIHREILKKIEAKLVNESHFVLNPLKADYEFWFLIRKDGYAFYGIRITCRKT